MEAPSRDPLKEYFGGFYSSILYSTKLLDVSDAVYLDLEILQFVINWMSNDESLRYAVNIQYILI